MNILRCLVGVDDMDFARHVHQHARVQNVEVLQVIQRNSGITRLFTLLDVFERHLWCLGQEDVHVWEPRVLFILERVRVVFLWSHKLLLEQVFPKHVARTEKTPFVNHHVLGFHGLKRL